MDMQKFFEDESGVKKSIATYPWCADSDFFWLCIRSCLVSFESASSPILPLVHHGANNLTPVWLRINMSHAYSTQYQLSEHHFIYFTIKTDLTTCYVLLNWYQNIWSTNIGQGSLTYMASRPNPTHKTIPFGLVRHFFNNEIMIYQQKTC